MGRFYVRNGGCFTEVKHNDRLIEVRLAEVGEIGGYGNAYRMRDPWTVNREHGFHLITSGLMYECTEWLARGHKIIPRGAWPGDALGSLLNRQPAKDVCAVMFVAGDVECGEQVGFTARMPDHDVKHTVYSIQHSSFTEQELGGELDLEAIDGLGAPFRHVVITVRNIPQAMRTEDVRGLLSSMCDAYRSRVMGAPIEQVISAVRMYRRGQVMRNSEISERLGGDATAGLTRALEIGLVVPVVAPHEGAEWSEEFASLGDPKAVDTDKVVVGFRRTRAT